MKSDVIIIIPVRMASKRLEGKPLLKYQGVPLIVHTIRNAEAAKLGDVFVATDSERIAEVVEAHGGKSILTTDCPNGSIRAHQAFVSLFDATEEIILVIQSDNIDLKPVELKMAVAPLRYSTSVDISTLVAPLRFHEISDPNVVKVIGKKLDNKWLRCFFFSRHLTIAPLAYHHIGVYAYRRKSLERFARLPVDLDLEQNAAMDEGMRIDASIIDRVPLRIDSLADLELAERRALT